MIWYIKSGILFFSALVLVPYLYGRLRPDEPAIKEGNTPLKKSQASSKFGDLKTSDLPAADMPAFGVSNSTPMRYLEMESQNEWLHPDVTRNRKLLKEKQKRHEESG